MDVLPVQTKVEDTQALVGRCSTKQFAEVCSSVGVCADGSKAEDRNSTGPRNDVGREKLPYGSDGECPAKFDQSSTVGFTVEVQVLEENDLWER